MKLRTPTPVVALIAAILVAVTAVGTAVAVFASGSGGQQLRVDTRTSNTPSSTTLNSFTDVPGAAVVVGVPEGQRRFFNARFTAASRCAAPTSGLGHTLRGCSVRIVATNLATNATVQLNPQTEGPNPYAFDSPERGDGLESHAMERSILLSEGRYRMHVEYAVSGPYIAGPGVEASATGSRSSATSDSVTFELDDWHLAVHAHALIPVP
jgi:hypothetical protein